MDIRVIPLKEHTGEIEDFEKLYYKKNDGDIIEFTREDISVMWQDKFLGFINFDICPFAIMWLGDYGKVWGFAAEEIQ